MTTLQQCNLPDQLVSCCDGSPKQVVVLHGEVSNSAIKLGHIEKRKEVGRVKHRGVGRKTGQSYIVVVRCDAFSACVDHTTVLVYVDGHLCSQCYMGARTCCPCTVSCTRCFPATLIACDCSATSATCNSDNAGQAHLCPHHTRTWLCLFGRLSGLCCCCVHKQT